MSSDSKPGKKPFRRLKKLTKQLFGSRAGNTDLEERKAFLRRQQEEMRREAGQGREEE